MLLFSVHNMDASPSVPVIRNFGLNQIGPNEVHLKVRFGHYATGDAGNVCVAVLLQRSHRFQQRLLALAGRISTLVARSAASACGTKMSVSSKNNAADPTTIVFAGMTTPSLID